MWEVPGIRDQRCGGVDADPARCPIANDLRDAEIDGNILRRRGTIDDELLKRCGKLECDVDVGPKENGRRVIHRVNPIQVARQLIELGVS